MGGQPHLRVRGLEASLFPLLRAQPSLGRGFTREEDVFGANRVVVIAHRFWQERFQGAADVLGRSLTLDGNVYIVIGVMPAGFRFAGFDADVWLPLALQPFEMENRGGHNYQAKPWESRCDAAGILTGTTRWTCHSSRL